MKKLIVMLAAALTYKKGQTALVDTSVADELVGKGLAAEVDQSLDQRDHKTPPGDEDALANSIAKALAPVVEAQKALAEKVDGMAKPARVKATKNADGIARAGDEPAEEPEVTLADVVAELRQLRATKGIEFRGRQVEDGSGLKLARYVRASAAASRGGTTVEKVLEKWGHKDMAKMVTDIRQKGLTEGTFTDGGALVPEQFSAELIPLLRNRAMVRKAGARVISMSGGNMTLPKGTGASTAYYNGEAQPVTTSKPQLGQVRFAEKKMMLGVPVSNDLLRNAALSADEWVRDDIVQVAVIKEDSQALFGVGSTYAPSGIVTLIDSTRKIDSIAADRTAPTLAETRKDLSRQIKLVKQSNIIGPNSKLGYIFNARYEAFLGSLTDGNGNAVFLQGLDNGTLRGYPVFVTEQVPDNLAGMTSGNSGTTDETRSFFGDFDSFVIAESEGGMQVTVFPNGTYEENGVAVSGISRDQTFVRLILLHDMNMRYTNGFAVMGNRPA